MNYSNSAAVPQHQNSAEKIKEWEAIADMHLKAGGVRVLGKLSTKAASAGAVDSSASILYKGEPLRQRDVHLFMGDMFDRISAEQRKAGKSSLDASIEARARVSEWSEKHLQDGKLRDDVGGA